MAGNEDRPDEPEKGDEPDDGDADTSNEAAPEQGADEGAEQGPEEGSDEAGGDSEEISESKAAEGAPSPANPPPPRRDGRASWGAPLHRIDRVWTRFESALCAAVLVTMILTLVFWIGLKALSSTGTDGAGQLFRSILTSLAFGLAAHFATRKTKGKAPVHEAVTTVAVVAGWIAGKYWGDAGTEYFANFQAWIQNASLFVFVGGIGELAKRLTLWLALLGASIATAQGKHINVDVVMRFLSPRARVPVAVLGWLTAALVSGAAAWGFFDDVAVEEFHAPPSVACTSEGDGLCPAPPGTKIDRVLEDTGRNLFLAGRQLSLDLRSLPKVVGGTPYARFLTPADWNAWLKAGGWEKHFSPEDVAALQLPEDGSIDFRTPAVTAVPGATERVHMLLVPLLNMVFPFGLLVIALRFVLRSLLALSGWVKVDPDAAHGDDELAHAHDAALDAGATRAATEKGGT